MVWRHSRPSNARSRDACSSVRTVTARRMSLRSTAIMLKAATSGVVSVNTFFRVTNAARCAVASSRASRILAMTQLLSCGQELAKSSKRTQK